MPSLTASGLVFGRASLHHDYHPTIARSIGLMAQHPHASLMRFMRLQNLFRIGVAPSTLRSMSASEESRGVIFGGHQLFTPIGTMAQGPTQRPFCICVIPATNYGIDLEHNQLAISHSKEQLGVLVTPPRYHFYPNGFRKRKLRFI